MQHPESAQRLLKKGLKIKMKPCKGDIINCVDVLKYKKGIIFFQSESGYSLQTKQEGIIIYFLTQKF